LKLVDRAVVHAKKNSHIESFPGAGGAGSDWQAATVVAAGGTGTRMGVAVPKQFLQINGKPVLLRTIENIVAVEKIAQVVVALPPEHIPRAGEILKRHPMRIPVECVAGGSSRQESVHCGVKKVLPEIDVIMVHDAVRPFCRPEMVRRILESAWEKGSAVAGMPATETIQRVSDQGIVLETPHRRELYAIQTPQAFRAEILRSALDRASLEDFAGTDESSVVRWAGHPVYIVEGSADNIKITRPLDLKLAELLMDESTCEEEEVGIKDTRVGQGIDYHRLVEGRKLVLGGVTVPFEKGLEGHSDADVLSHAVCDALLGAACVGDIGRHFPDDDPANRGRSSIEFLQEVRARIGSEGWRICSVDATLLAQRPKLAPFMQEMRRNIASALGLEEGDVNVKATTTEGLNAEGRGEGISSHAVALICR